MTWRIQADDSGRDLATAALNPLRRPRWESLSRRAPPPARVARVDRGSAGATMPTGRSRRMQYRHMGRSGLRVSEICLGTITFGL